MSAYLKMSVLTNKCHVIFFYAKSSHREKLNRCLCDVHIAMSFLVNIFFFMIREILKSLIIMD